MRQACALYNMVRVFVVSSLDGRWKSVYVWCFVGGVSDTVVKLLVLRAASTAQTRHQSFGSAAKSYARLNQRRASSAVVYCTFGQCSLASSPVGSFVRRSQDARSFCRSRLQHFNKLGGCEHHFSLRHAYIDKRTLCKQHNTLI